MSARSTSSPNDGLAEDSTLVVDPGSDGPDEDGQIIAGGDHDEDATEEETEAAWLLCSLGLLGIRGRRRPTSDPDAEAEARSAEASPHGAPTPRS